jgi:endonuclease/exonuclease/phosphatase family metal-dependent hydrolase
MGSFVIRRTHHPFQQRSLSVWKAVRTTGFLGVMMLFATSALAQYPAQVKFLSYNLWGYRNAETPGGYDSLAAVINEIGAAVSGHQEVDRANTRSKGVDVIAYLGERTGMHSLFAPALKGWNGGDYGEGLLAQHPPLSHRFFWVEEPEGEDRSAVEIDITMAGERVRFLTTHLAHENDAFRAHQAREMVAWIDEGGGEETPMVILGDFNSRPGDEAMSQYEEAGFVYVRDSSGEILDEIDHIMVRPRERWRVVEADKPTQYTASDHDPVWATLELLDPNSSNGKKPRR